VNIAIYQINYERDKNRVKFDSLKNTAEHAEKVDPAIYDLVYEGNVDCKNLEDVFSMFNIEAPITHRGHSLSVSDVVKIKENEANYLKGCFFCDSIGFEKIDFDTTQTHKPDNLLKVVVVEPNKEPYVAEIQDDYKSIQRVVGGLFQCTYPFDDDTVIYSNDEAKLIGMDGNRTINGQLYAGAFFIARDIQDGTTGSLSNEQIAKYTDIFKEIESFTPEDVEDSIFMKFISF